MWYEWEWSQFAREKWHRLENKPSGLPARKLRWRLLVEAARSYLQVGKPQKLEATLRDAINLADQWVMNNFQDSGVWVGTGQN